MINIFSKFLMPKIFPKCFVFRGSFYHPDFLFESQRKFLWSLEWKLLSWKDIKVKLIAFNKFSFSDFRTQGIHSPQIWFLCSDISAQKKRIGGHLVERNVLVVWALLLMNMFCLCLNSIVFFSQISFSNYSCLVSIELLYSRPQDLPKLLLPKYRITSRCACKFFWGPVKTVFRQRFGKNPKQHSERVHVWEEYPPCLGIFRFACYQSWTWLDGVLVTDFL